MFHIVGFSGGIDSQAVARWVRNRYPKDRVILTNSNAGQWEDPLTEAFIEEYSATQHPVTRCNAKVKDLWKTPGFAETKGLDGEVDLTFTLMCQIKGRPPSRKAQFCTEVLKLIPQRRWIREAFGPTGQYAGEEFVRYSGVRRDESKPRENQAIEDWDDFYDCALICAIADWTKKMCFDYVESHGEQVNPLYRLGFGRVGCAPCINSSKEDILNWFVRRPEMIDKVRRLEQEELTFFYPVRRDGVPNSIDEVIEWAKTSRGGSDKQGLFPILLEHSESCSSKYGLCE